MRVSWKPVVVFALAGFVAGVSLTDCGHASDEDAGTSAQDTASLSKHWEIAIPHQPLPAGLTSLSAADCGACHQVIYEEWKQSTHALAFQDLQFQAEFKKNSIYACLNCHTPLQNQQEFIVTGLVDSDYTQPVRQVNPHFDKSLQAEGITCASCHVRDGQVIGTTGSGNAPHPVRKDPTFLSERLCMSCHNVTDELNLVLVCSFETGDEWRDNWAAREGKTCISCHMPQTERPIAVGFARKTSHSHFFPGSGIPKFHDIEAVGLNGLDITPGHVQDHYAPGERLSYSLKVMNRFAGHSVPTGDPERFILVRFHVLDMDDRVLAAQDYRIGEHWQWHPEARKLSDNNLAPLEERAFGFSFDLPARQGLRFVVRVSKHRITRENSEYLGITEQYPDSILVFHRSYPVDVR